ncbi:MAG: hypothetical protein GTN76_08655, partial [Candidatus Aenigmarchaeota archaeon]|nr:hypothetical protein [Candidatus Aenigmarchaeota archaeon]
SNAIIDELIKESKKSKIRDEMAKHIKDPDPDKLQDLIDRLSRIDAAESEVDIYRQVDGVLREIKQAKERGQLGFPTPFENINNAIRGLQPGHLWVIGGYTSAGKTTMGISLIWNFLKEGAKVAYFSTEIPSNDLIIKCAAHETGIPFLKIKSG